MRFLPILAGSLAMVAASPFPEPTGDLEKRASSSCKDNTAYKDLSSQGAKGTNFCYDYLHLPTVTQTANAPRKTK